MPEAFEHASAQHSQHFTAHPPEFTTVDACYRASIAGSLAAASIHRHQYAAAPIVAAAIRALPPHLFPRRKTVGPRWVFELRPDTPRVWSIGFIDPVGTEAENQSPVEAYHEHFQSHHRHRRIARHRR
ncbi:hypothetical protein [Burkholderia sp. Bp9143]|uniref:hypothetical protein n=1 Tax=Burkholderia sp. Bp9143 TaxID=2184574 RepID=UPI000F591015|nr:hypothetical protein [Burkholderia sp. Bp9143]